MGDFQGLCYFTRDLQDTNPQKERIKYFRDGRDDVFPYFPGFQVSTLQVLEEGASEG
jgi:hypothetical protein